jgi:hypothetical protein
VTHAATHAQDHAHQDHVADQHVHQSAAIHVHVLHQDHAVLQLHAAQHLVMVAINQLMV